MADASVLATFTSTFEPRFMPDTINCTLSLMPYIRHIADCFSQLEGLFASICPDGYKRKQQIWHLASAIALQEHISTCPHFSLETAAAHLRAEQLLLPSGPTASTFMSLHQYYVFCLVGISAHLFQPSARGVRQSVFSIEDCISGSIHHHRCWSILSSKITVTEPRLPLVRILRGFGELSPVMDGDQRRYHTSIVSLRPEKFNAHLFCSVLKMNLMWTHLLNAHLDYNTETNTLYLFKYPTFCLMHSAFAREADKKGIWDR